MPWNEPNNIIFKPKRVVAGWKNSFLKIFLSSGFKSSE